MLCLKTFILLSLLACSVWCGNEDDEDQASRRASGRLAEKRKRVNDDGETANQDETPHEREDRQDSRSDTADEHFVHNAGQTGSNRRSSRRSAKERPKSKSREKSTERSRSLRTFTSASNSPVGLATLKARNSDDWLEFSTRDLKDSCRAVALDERGTRSELAARLTEFYREINVGGQHETGSIAEPRESSTNANLIDTSIPEHREAFDARNAGSVRIRTTPTEHATPNFQVNHIIPQVGGQVPPLSYEQLSFIVDNAVQRALSINSRRSIFESTNSATNFQNSITSNANSQTQSDPQVFHSNTGLLNHHTPSQRNTGLLNSNNPSQSNTGLFNLNLPSQANTGPSRLNTNSDNLYPSSFSMPNVAYPLNHNIPSSVSGPNLHQAADFSRLPTVPAELMQKIVDGKFVNFDLLVDCSYSEEERRFSLVTEGSHLDIIPKPRGKKITDINRWLKAFNLFMRTLIFFYPDLSNSLLVYQSNIIRFASMYAFHQVYTYDKHFRTRKVFDRNLRWDMVCEEIFTETLRGASCSRAQNGENGCFLCGNTRHYANACPLQQSPSSHNPNFRPPQSNQQNFRASNPSTSTHRASNPSTSTQPQKAPADGICYDYNKKSGCSKTDCTFKHVCWKCQQKHSCQVCPQQD